MADIDDDPFASMMNDCVYSSSQEELLKDTKFALEDEIFAGDDGEPSGMVDSGQLRTKFDGADVAGRRNQVKFAGGSADCEKKEVLGFPEEGKKSTIEVVFDGEVRVSEAQKAESVLGPVRERENGEEGSSIEPPLKKSRVSASKLKGEKFSPLVHCNEKFVMDSKDKGKQIVVFKGGFRLAIVSPLRCIAPSGVDCTEELVFEDGMRGEKSNTAKRKLELENNTKEIEVEEDETNEPKKNEEMGNDVDGTQTDDNEKGDGNWKDGSSEGIEVEENETNEPKKNEEIGYDVDAIQKDDSTKGDENRKDFLSEEIEIHGKRQLPSSLLGQNWSLNADESDGTEDGELKDHEEKCERSTDENGGHKSKTDEKLRYLLNVLKMLASQMLCDDANDDVDIIETAKRRGMTFPCSRFRVDVEMDE